MKYRQHDGRENVLTFGHYPEVAIDKAREHRLTARHLLKQNQDVGADLILTQGADPNMTQGGTLHF